MSISAEKAQSAIDSWLKKGPKLADVTALPQLSTAHYAAFVGQQPNVSGRAGQHYLFTDGDAVLTASPETFAKIMQAEGVPAQPDALPASQIALLYLRLSGSQRGHPIEQADDPALEKLSSSERSAFQPPSAKRDGDELLVRFWSSTSRPLRVERWELRIAADGSVTESVA